ncbi:Actinohivin [Folsomia candida]|uniref:Actinohivin n=1 Tax=Folsomia candida TaxID=158441 RepID=A0A226DWP1_FOLCA|nr:Actinohivin [Folsomia candida]
MPTSMAPERSGWGPQRGKTVIEQQQSPRISTEHICTYTNSICSSSRQQQSHRISTEVFCTYNSFTQKVPMSEKIANLENHIDKVEQVVEHLEQSLDRMEKWIHKFDKIWNPSPPQFEKLPLVVHPTRSRCEGIICHTCGGVPTPKLKFFVATHDLTYNSEEVKFQDPAYNKSCVARSMPLRLFTHNYNNRALRCVLIHDSVPNPSSLLAVQAVTNITVLFSPKSSGDQESHIAQVGAPVDIMYTLYANPRPAIQWKIGDTVLLENSTFEHYEVLPLQTKHYSAYSPLYTSVLRINPFKIEDLLVKFQANFTNEYGSLVVYQIKMILKKLPPDTDIEKYRKLSGLIRSRSVPVNVRSHASEITENIFPSDIWIVKGNATFQNLQSKLCLSDTGVLNTTICADNDDSQKWTISSNQSISNVQSGRCLTLHQHPYNPVRLGACVENHVSQLFDLWGSLRPPFPTKDGLRVKSVLMDEHYQACLQDVDGLITKTNCTPSSGTWMWVNNSIQSFETARCLDGLSDTLGRLYSRPCTSDYSNYQRWRFHMDGSIINERTGKCVTTRYNGIYLNPCLSTSNQRYNTNGGNVIIRRLEVFEPSLHQDFGKTNLCLSDENGDLVFETCYINEE